VRNQKISLCLSHDSERYARWFITDQRGNREVNHPHSDAPRPTKRLHRVDHDNMELAFTIDDPKTYTTQWTFGTKTMNLKPGWEIGELFSTLDDQKNFEKTVMEFANKP